MKCRHRTKLARHRRREVAEQLKDLPLTDALTVVLERAAVGEYVGQSDGNIFRVEHLAEQFTAGGSAIEDAVRDIPGYEIVVGVVLPRS